MRIFLATNNEHKLKEFKQMLGDDIVFGADKLAGEMPEVEENADTFLGNARLKANSLISKLENQDDFVLADDSGLCVEALNNAPSIYSARFAKMNNSSKTNNEFLLEKLENIENRKAYFVCVLVLKSKTKEEVFEGKVFGEILKEETSGERFGYDPLFLPMGCNLSMAQMSKEQKNEISHRAIATNSLKKYLQSSLNSI